MIVYALILGVALLYLFLREGSYVTVTAMTYGLMAVIYGLGHLYYYNVQDFDQTAENVTASLCWMWIMFVAGNELCRLAFPRASARQRALLASWSTTPMQAGAHAEWLWRLILLLSVGILAVAFVAFGKVGTLAQYATLQTAEDVRDFRATLTAQGGYPFQLFVASIAPFLAVVALLIGMRQPNLYNRAMAVALVVLVLLFKLSTYQKTQWIWVLISLALGWYLVRRIRMRIGTIVVSASLIFLAFMLGAMLAFPGIEIADMANFVLYRIFEICNEGLYQTYYVYPQYLDHTHGLNIGLIHDIYGYGDLIPAHTQVARFYGSYGTTYNAMFLADAWVDFGMTGVIVVSLFIGFLIKAVDLYIATLGKTPVSIAITASCFFGAISLASVSAFTSLLTGGIALLPLFVASVDALGKRIGRPLLRERSRGAAQPG